MNTNKKYVFAWAFEESECVIHFVDSLEEILNMIIDDLFSSGSDYDCQIKITNKKEQLTIKFKDCENNEKYKFEIYNGIENVESLLNELNEIQDRDYHFCIEELPTN